MSDGEETPEQPAARATEFMALRRVTATQQRPMPPQEIQTATGKKHMPRPSASILVLALNEAGNIKNAVAAVTEAALKLDFNDFEIVLVDGGSTDGTAEIMDELAAGNARIRVARIPVNSPQRGLGYGFQVGLKLASKEYVGWFPGDNETLPETIQNILDALGRTDAIIPYTANPWVRPLHRRMLSVIYTALWNALFGLRLRYFNGPCFFRRAVLQSITMTTTSPAYMAEILVQLIKLEKASYLEVPMYIKERDYGRPSVLKWRNVLLIGKTLLSLFFRIHWNKTTGRTHA